jgi:TetR/AcrR family transcriptional regulator
VPPAQQRLSKTERRRQLLETAQQVFAACGFKGTTTRDLARAAGVSEAVIFQHFPNKAALYAAVLEERNVEMWPEEWMAELEARQRAGDDEGFVRLLYSHTIEQCEHHPYYPRLVLYSVLEPHPVTRRVQNSTVPRLQEALRAFILAGQQAGRFGSGSVGLLIRVLLALPHYHVLQTQLFKNPWQTCERDEMLEVGVRFALAGLARGASAACSMANDSQTEDPRPASGIS